MAEPHPSTDIIGTLSSDLKGKRIVLALCGSVAVLKSVGLARLLMRHGAEIIPVMSAAAAGLVSPQLLHWATGRKPVLELSGDVEHVCFAGNTKTKADLLLIAPATANTVGKIACGIDGPFYGHARFFGARNIGFNYLVWVVAQRGLRIA